MKKKVTKSESIPGFEESIITMSKDNKIFVDKSLEIASFIGKILEKKGLKQKDLAQLMGKSEAEISKLLAGLHNYTLRSLAKIEAVLDEQIICTPGSKEPSFTVSSRRYVSGVKSITPDDSIYGNIIYPRTKVVEMFNAKSSYGELTAI